MPRCLHCGESLLRAHRKFWEKPVYSVVFKCRGCDLRVGEKHNFLHYFARHTRCPRCGTDEVDKRITRDKIDKVIRSPISLAQALMGGQLYHCVFCRIQFYDLRGKARKSSRHRGEAPVPAKPNA